MQVRRSVTNPIRSGLSIEERWKSPDEGVIAAWERGREISEEASPDSEDLTLRARRGELVILPWKGGVKQGLKIKRKFGTMRYFAMWQGLRGEDLDVDLESEPTRECSATGIVVTYTTDLSKYGGSDE